MSVLSDYFSAPSDEAAARAATDGLSQPPYEVLQMRDLFPDYHLVPLEVFLTGRSAEAVGEGPRHGRLLASVDDEVVVTVSDELTASLAAASSGLLAEAAASWSQFGDFQDKDTSGMAGFLGDLAGLARRATARKEHLYCMMSCLRRREVAAVRCRRRRKECRDRVSVSVVRCTWRATPTKQDQSVPRVR
jgi:hypothetical protein